ncbi:MAG: NosD domain-containing protein, partial [Methanosarcinaceae archaeon]|nr:NosD domain-containing protein [Methanosarcinaceae archaeon]
MKKREIIGLIILFFLVLISTGPASAATLTVDDDGSANYTSIREAVNSANENDTIFVYSGTYAGNISVDKKLVLKGVDKGNGMPVIDGSECNENGFSLFADEITLDGFEIRNCDEGIRVFSAGNTIINNTLSNCFFGIWVYEIVDRSVWRHISSNNYIENNKIFENSYGILLDKSDGNILRNNDMLENYYNFQLWSGTYAHNDIDKSNLVNGKPLYYLVGKSDTVIDSSLDVGALYCIDCYNISILNLEIKGSGNGINLFNISNSLVRDNTISSCREGLTITESSGNTIRDNQISSGYYGLILNDLHDNVFRNNRMSSNEYNFEARNCKANDLDISNTVDGKPIYYLYGEAGDVIDASSNAGTVYCIDCDDIVIEGLDLKNSDNGICLYNTSNSLVKDNTISSCDEGIRIIDSSGNTILNNQITSSYFGLLLDYSNGNNFRNNLMSSNMWNFAARGCKANDLDLSNTVDGKPIYYLYGESGKIIDASSNAGLVYCRDCSDITIKDLSLKNNYNGVCLENTSNSIIENCIIDDCGSGVELSDCSNSNILGNRINVENGWDAIEIFGCDNNLFADNILNVEESGLYGIDMWDSHGNIFVRNRITAYETLISLDNDIDNTFYLNDFWLEDDFPGIVGASAPVDSPSPSLIPERAFRNFERERPEKFCEEYNEADGIKLTFSASGGGSGEDGINTGFWNSSEALNYSYQGKKFTGYLGNYWNYYEASDSNGDGIGNSPCMV